MVKTMHRYGQKLCTGVFIFPPVMMGEFALFVAAVAHESHVDRRVVVLSTLVSGDESLPVLHTIMAGVD